MHPDPVGSLTRREIEVLWLLDARLSIEEIAEVLHLSPEALQSYRSRLVRKLTLRLLPPCNPERSQERPDGHRLFDTVPMDGTSCYPDRVGDSVPG